MVHSGILQRFLEIQNYLIAHTNETSPSTADTPEVFQQPLFTINIKAIYHK